LFMGTQTDDKAKWRSDSACQHQRAKTGKDGGMK